MNTNNEIQQQATTLGYLGVIPFLAVLLLFSDFPQDKVINSIEAYAAIILTFVGAIHWGRALNEDSDTGRSSLLTISVMPSLIAWISLLLPGTAGLLLLISAFLILLIFDFKEYHALIWFRRLRIQLTIIVCSCLLFSLIIIT